MNVHVQYMPYSSTKCWCTFKQQPLLQALAVMRLNVVDTIHCSLHVNLSSDPTNQKSSVGLGAAVAVFFSVCRAVLSCQQPVRDIVRERHLCSTFGAMAERSAEAITDWLGKQYKHNAVGCSLQGVANTLLDHNRRL